MQIRGSNYDDNVTIGSLRTQVSKHDSVTSSFTRAWASNYNDATVSSIKTQGSKHDDMIVGYSSSRTKGSKCDDVTVGSIRTQGSSKTLLNSTY